MRFIKANSIFDGTVFLPEGSILVLDQDNRLVEIVNGKQVPEDKTEFLNGIVTPGFINAHCHLELSHLKDVIPKYTGIVGFGKQIITKRGNYTTEETKSAMQAADLAMWNAGIVAVGDISNVEDSFEIKKNSKLYYHTFIELIGFSPAFAEAIQEKGLELYSRLKEYGLSGSLAPHAPYTVSNELINFISDFDSKNNLSFSIHNQESEEETKFFMGEKSDFHELYSFLNIDVSYFKPTLKSSLKSYSPFLQQTPSLLVHNTFTSAEDISEVQSKNVYWCFCPNANLYIENRLPDYTLFETQKEKICLGTDSLASNSQLDLVKEANVFLKNTNVFSLANVLRMMTFNGASALGISDEFGALRTGKNTGLNLLRYQNRQLHFIKKII